ncbi:MAG: DNA methyltransferase [Mycoplasmatales bacterium]
MKVTDKITITNEDNMELMARYPDNFFDLAIVDPPYGINADKKNNGYNSYSHLKNSKAKINNYKIGWDSCVPTIEYFNELKRVSKKQIIWGINYYHYSNLFIGGRLFWDKGVTMPTYSKGELAYLSWLNSIDVVNINWHGMIQQDMKNKEIRIHPTQKPVALYKWLLEKYAKQGDKILDTHLGSGSIAIACHDYDFELTACELDEEYYNKAIERIKNHTSQQKIF